MARYSKDHKAETHDKILQAAAEAFREDGLPETSIPRIMEQVGLTHGGFYAHFPNKDALVSEACAHTLLGSVERTYARGANAPEGQGVRAIVDHYLSPTHRDNRSGGCVIPALGSEISRAPDEVRHPFSEALRQYFATIEPFIADSVKEEVPDAELALAATMVGGLLLARVVDDPELSDRILDTCREWAIDRFGEPAGEPGDSDPTHPPPE